MCFKANHYFRVFVIKIFPKPPRKRVGGKYLEGGGGLRGAEFVVCYISQQFLN